MKQALKLVLIMVMGISMIFTGCTATASTNYEEKEAMLDKHMQQFFTIENAPSISILVIDNEEPVYKKSFGYANVETLEKANPETTYRIASMSKMFTAMGIVILKDRGMLDYDMKVSEIFDDFPDYGKDITIRHLLYHTSGLKDFYDFTDLLDEEFDVENQLLDYDVYEIVKRLDSTYFEPGTIHKYTDTGYVMLGLIVEKVSGMNYPDFMRENIFEPLGMEDSQVYDKALEMNIRNRSYGAEYGDDKYITKDQSYSSATRGDGSVYTSLEDIYKWDKALYTDALVSSDTMKEAYTPPKHLNNNFDNYTCGWSFRQNGAGELELDHAGGTQGFSTMYIRMPEKKQAIIILSNRNNSSIVYELHEEIRSIYGFGKANHINY